MPRGGPYTIYPDTVNWYQTNQVPWSVARDGDSSVVPAGGVNINLNKAFHEIVDAGGGIKYVFSRIYMQFDISNVTEPITSMQLYVQGDTVSGDTTYVAYAGSKNALSNNANDYPLYIANLAEGTGAELATVVIPSNQYVSCNLNFSAYPIYGDDPTTPSYQYYNVALVADSDFLNNIGGTFGGTRIVANNVVGKPYLVINGSGYANNVSGVPGVNITTVSGVPSADITNIMGV
jgi:hypothetical protein